MAKSDFRDPRTNLFELLPNVNQSETNEAVFEDVFNRYLSKPQIELVDGFVGEPFNNTVQQRQITEPTPHRQAFQLQPLLHTQIGTINHLASYVDILNEIERLGVETCRLPLWGNALKFNWTPPIDIDKLVNFRDYYWFDEDDPAANPQYITIENPCIKATQRVEAYEETIDTFGDLQEIVLLTANSITINGDLSDVFTKGFVFFVTNSTLNVAINESFFTTVSSSYDSDNDLTTIVVEETITDTTVDGDISLQVFLTLLQAEQQCACGDDVGWDIALWDDNQVGAVLWSSGLLAAISWDTEAEWVANNQGSVGSPGEVPEDFSLWYDTSTNQLKQFLGAGSPNWQVVQNNFSAIVSLVEGTHLWDYTSTCDIESNPWTDENVWFHKNHVPNLATAKQAQLPIIEYDFGTQLNRWTFTDYVWKYRESGAFNFEISSVRPSLNELIPFKYVINDSGVGSPVLNQITISPEYGDQTSTFVAGYQFRIQSDGLDVNNNGTYTVVTSSYASTTTTNGNELATIIEVEETFSSANQSTSSIGSPATVGSGGEMVPQRTSLGHTFQSYNEHWLLDDSVPGVEPATGKLLPVPSPPPTLNPFIDLDYLTTPVDVPGVGSYLTSTPVDLRVGYGTEEYVLTMEYTVLPTLAPGGVPVGTVIPLDPRMISRAPLGESIVRVVVNGQQIYGTFTELDSGVAFGSPVFGGSPISPGSPAAGSPREGVDDGFVDSITLAFDLDEFDIVRITVAEQAVEDFGRAAVPVRTIEDDVLFSETGSPLGSQPELVSLIQYRRIDPLKTQTNEYPLFDLFDCFGEPLFQASPLFKWRTNQNNDINTNIGLRIVGTTTADYEFENLLIDSDTLPRPILFTYKLDGELQTVWRKGLNDEEYVPSFVNSSGVVGSPAITVGDPNGSWEIPDQLYFNAEHENKQFVTFPQFISHFRSILNEQQDFPGVTLSGGQAYLHQEYNFGLGGLIKEHNDSYDTFLSSTFVNNVSPLGVIDFAHDQYENSLNTIKEFYRRSLTTFLTDTSTSNITNLQTFINNSVISTYELNDFFELVYGDSNTFIAGSPQLGVRNWPATLPFVGLEFKHQPYIIEDETLDFLQLIHHDGHRSEPSLTVATRESVIQTVLNTQDSRVTGETFGVQQNTGTPSLFSDLQTFITPRPGIYWYSVIGSTRTLFRFNVVAVDSIEPSGVPVGSLWYDTAEDLLKELQSDLTWVAVEGSPSVGIIDQAWEEIDFNDLLINLLLEIEQRLHDAAPDLTTLDFDINSISTNDISCPTNDTTRTEADTIDNYLEQAFSNFLRDVNVDDAFSADQFFVATDAFTWNYSLSTITTPPKTSSPSGQTTGWWTNVYKNLYGTPYPHLEPWVLQGYEEKPSWWDDEYLNNEPTVYGSRRWKYIHGTGSPLPSGMWENIRIGVVPTGQLLPDGTTSTGTAGEVQTWNYFSVNISDSTLDGFDPDDVFPPYWDFIANGGSAIVRSVFSDLAGEIVFPGADYTFETGGSIFFDWTTSSQRLYDNLTVGFRMQPVRFIHSTFGVNFIEVDGLQLNEFDCKVYSHRDVLFHGDIINMNQVIEVDGINQWYVNFNRFNGYDVASSDFRPLWQSWEPLLTYQFGSIIDTNTLRIENSNFDITERDHNVLMKKSPGIDDFFLDALNVTVLESPNKLARVDTQHLWKFQIDTFFPTTRELPFYEVHNYPVRADELANTFHLYQFDIVDVDISGVFFLEGDQTTAFTGSLEFTVAESTGNNGTYTATSVSFNSSTNRTAITVNSTLSAVADGYLETTYRTLTWQTGDKIELTAVQVVPAPLAANREYFIIRINDTTFQLANTLSDALSGVNINLGSTGSGQIHAGQVFSKFVALNGAATNRVWNHYTIDTRFTRTIVPPSRVTGIQNLINLIDGYAIILSEDGWNINLENLEQDPDTGRPVSWQLETERFIDQIFRLPQQRVAIPNMYAAVVDSTNDNLTFSSVAPVWSTGTKVSVSAGTGTLPAPLLQNQPYHVISIDEDTIQLALTSSDALLGIPINIIPGGSATINVFETPTPRTRTPSIEINPVRNNVWLNTPQGILSNVVDGPTDDIRNTQLITDQAGNQLTGRDISVFRWDKVARIFVPRPFANSSVPKNQITPYNTIHMGSIQAFVDGYEHVVLFNDYATDGTLIYDPFVGLNTQRFSLRFFRQDEFTQRPVVGGYFLTQNEEIIRNIEGNVLDLQTLYDTYRVLETTPLIKEGRRTLGYRETEQGFLDSIGLNPKSKFIFWRGMIQNKGSVKAIDAFTNSIKFDDAIVDEFWAHKVADFGTSYEQEYPSLNLFIEDSRRSEKRFQFLASGETQSQTFEGVRLTNQNRWFNQPDVLQILGDNNDSFYFDAEVTSTETFTDAIPFGSPTQWFWTTAVPFDDVVILRVEKDTNTLVSELADGSPAVDFEIINSRLIKFSSNPGALIAGSPLSEEFRIYTINPAEDKHNPSKVIDIKDDRVISDVPMWDPIRGDQYHIGNNLVTFESSDDPASYTDALDSLKVDDEFWNAPEVGMIWWDTSQRGYIPYNDRNIFAIDDRIQNWGKLADWASVDLYQWTQSDILPNEWDAVAAREELDVSIDPLARKTGRVKLETFQREREALDIITVYPSESNTGSPQFPVNTIVVDDSNQTLALNEQIVFTTDDELPIPLQIGVFYFIVSINNSVPSQTEIQISTEQGGDVLEIKPGAVIIDINGGVGSPGVVDGSGATGLVNDFNTSGVQRITFSTTKSLGSSTGLTLGTRGFQEVSFPIAVNASSPTGLEEDTNGVQQVAFGLVGSPALGSPLTFGSPTWFCGALAGLTAGFYSFQISFDGNAPITVIIFADETYTFINLVSAIDAYLQLSTQGTVSCENQAPGFIFTSNTKGPSSTVEIIDGGFVGTPLFASIDAATYSAEILEPIDGQLANNFTATVSINGGSAQTLDINGTDAQTFGALVTQINNQITGANAAVNGGKLRITSNETGTSSTVAITDVDLFSSMAVGGSPGAGTIEAGVPGTSVLYLTNIAVDGGGQQVIVITGDEAQTFAELIDVLNNNITGATVSLLSNALRITSNSTGSNSSIDVIDGGGSPTLAGIFTSLSSVITPFPAPDDGVDATTYTTEIDVENGPRLITIVGNTAQNWNSLLSEFNAQLPVGSLSFITRGSPQEVDLLLSAGNNTVSIENDNLFTRLGETFGSPEDTAIFFNQFIPLDTGDGNHQIVPSFSDDDWIQLEDVSKELISARDNNGNDQFDATVLTGSPITSNSILPGDEVDVYINGTAYTGFTGSPALRTTVDVSGFVTITGTNPQDFITIRKEKHIVTDEEAAFDPDEFDDGSNLIQFKNDYNFSTTFRINSSGNQVPVYYFWVTDKTVRERNNITMRRAAIELETIPTPYMVVDNLLTEVGSPLSMVTPKRYTQLILRGLAGVIDDQDRYVLRFTRDFSLRDQLLTRNYTTDLTADFARIGAEPLDLKTHHTEWSLIREKQPFNIPRDLWNKITEAMIAHKLNDSTSRVPSLSREMYDAKFGTDTRFGLSNGQAFVDGQLALNTLLDDLQDPNNNFAPININSFFASHDFETDEGIIEAMDDIYNSFSFTSVNRIFFKILLDAFTTKQKYPDIFKTSWVSLSGTQILQTEELFTG